MSERESLTQELWSGWRALLARLNTTPERRHKEKRPLTEEPRRMIVCEACAGVGLFQPLETQPDTVGNRFRRVRMSGKLTLLQMATMLGIARPTLNQIELDIMPPSAIVLVTAARIGDCSVDYLLCLTSNARRNK